MRRVAIHERQQRTGYALLFVTIVFFSTYEVVNKLIAAKVDPFQINFIRFLVGGLILLAVAAAKRELAITPRDFALCVLAGVLNVVVSMGLINLSLAAEGSSAAVCAVLFSCNPLFVSVFASLFDGERVGGGKAAALALGIAGTVLISSGKMAQGLAGLAGPAMALLSAVTFALYTVLGKKISARTGSLRMNAYAFTSGSLLLLALLSVFKRPTIYFDLSITGWVVYLSVFVTGLAYLAYFRGLTIVGSGKGSLVFFLKPVFATVLAAVFLGERASVSVVAGIALILFSIALAVHGSPLRREFVR